MPDFSHPLSAIRKLANPTKAQFLQRFFKTGPGEYAEGDVFAGLTVPQTRQLARQYPDLSFDDTKRLLKSEIHEARLLALLIWVRQFRRGDERLRQRLHLAYLKHAKYVNNWDLVDLSAEVLVGEFLLDRPRSLVRRLATSKLLWHRRIAVLATFAFIKAGQFADTLALARMLLHDKQDLIHKAVGWMLREVGKRDPQRLEHFLKPVYLRMPRTMLRYAIEKFPESRRRKYLLGKM